MTILLSRDKQRAMKTSIEHIRAKITELEARITDLRITERELEALDTAPAPRGKLKAKAKRKSATHNASEARQTVGTAITEVLNSDRRASAGRARRADHGGRAGGERRDAFEYASDDEKARRGQEWRRQMDAAEDTREESQRLTVLPRDYGMLVR